MKKRLLSLFLILTLSILMISGCGSDEGTDEGTTDTAEETTLTMWTIATESDSFHQPYLDAIKDYEAANPGIKINMETFENESYKTKIKSAVAANELPDIFFTWAGGFSEEFVESGKVMELDSVYSNYSADLPETALNNTTYNDKLYGVTMTTPVSVIWYNKAMFDEQGITEFPATWDEFKTACQKFIDAGITPIGTSVKDTWVLAMLHDALALKSAGADKLTSTLLNQETPYNDPDFLAAATGIKELVDMKAFIDGATGLTNDEASAEFYAEKVPMYITGSWMGGSIITDAENPDNFSVAPVPVVNDANAAITDFMGGGSDTLMVYNESENKDAAAKAAFEITKSVSKYAYLSGAGIPAWKVDYDTASVPALTQAVTELATNATSYTLWFDTLMTADDAAEYLTLLQSLYTGDLTPKKFVEDMDAQLKK